MRRITLIYAIYASASSRVRNRSAVFKWVHDQQEPTPETIVEIVKTLKQINPDAAQEFIQLYLGNLLDDRDEPEQE